MLILYSRFCLAAWGVPHVSQNSLTVFFLRLILTGPFFSEKTFFAPQARLALQLQDDLGRNLMKIKAQDKVGTSIVSSTTFFFDLKFTWSVPRRVFFLKSGSHKASTFCLQHGVLKRMSDCMSFNLVLTGKLQEWGGFREPDQSGGSGAPDACFGCCAGSDLPTEIKLFSTSQTFCPTNLGALPRFSALPISRGPWLICKPFLVRQGCAETQRHLLEKKYIQSVEVWQILEICGYSTVMYGHIPKNWWLVDFVGCRVSIRSRGIFTKGSKQQCVGVHPGAELKEVVEDGIVEPFVRWKHFTDIQQSCTLLLRGFDFLSTISLTTWYNEFMIIHLWKSTLEGAGWSTRSGCLLLRDYGRRCGCDGEFLRSFWRKILLNTSVPPKNRGNRHGNKNLLLKVWMIIFVALIVSWLVKVGVWRF